MIFITESNQKLSEMKNTVISVLAVLFKLKIIPSGEMVRYTATEFPHKVNKTP